VISATLIIGPVVIPLLPTFGVDFMHFGLLMTVNLAIGYCTPPVGVSMYITGAMVNKDIVYVTKAVIPFIIIQIAVLFTMTYIPDLVLWLPKAMGFWEAIETSMPAL
jgi:C4-dicarboxylate transporter DctM subunit